MKASTCWVPAKKSGGVPAAPMPIQLILQVQGKEPELQRNRIGTSLPRLRRVSTAQAEGQVYCGVPMWNTASRALRLG